MREIVTVGGREIGLGRPVFIVVELGVCHEQNVGLAKHFIRRAREAGADAVKVESFQADDFAFDRDLTHTYGVLGGERTENYYRMLKRLELSYDDYRELKRTADAEGILFFSTVHNPKNADIMQDMGVCAFKIASSDVTNLPLIRDLAGRGLPVFMDTGGAYLGEIERAVREFESRGFADLALMHNPLGYPAPLEKTDLRMIPALAGALGLPVGLSCHTPGFDMVVAAVALGACAVEKPVSRDRSLPSPEHVFSFLDSETETFVAKVRDTETALGEARRRAVPDTAYSRKTRRGTYAARDLAAGEALDAEKVVFGRPLKGIPVELADAVLGRTLKRPKARLEPIGWEDLA